MSDNLHITLEVVKLIGGVLLVLFWLTGKKYATWARKAFGIAGLIVFFGAGVHLCYDLMLLPAQSDNIVWRLLQAQRFLNGIAVGLLFATLLAKAHRKPDPAG